MAHFARINHQPRSGGRRRRLHVALGLELLRGGGPRAARLAREAREARRLGVPRR